MYLQGCEYINTAMPSLNVSYSRKVFTRFPRGSSVCFHVCTSIYRVLCLSVCQSVSMPVSGHKMSSLRECFQPFEKMARTYPQMAVVQRAVKSKVFALYPNNLTKLCLDFNIVFTVGQNVMMSVQHSAQ